MVVAWALGKWNAALQKHASENKLSIIWALTCWGLIKRVRKASSSHYNPDLSTKACFPSLIMLLTINIYCLRLSSAWYHSVFPAFMWNRYYHWQFRGRNGSTRQLVLFPRLRASTSEIGLALTPAVCIRVCVSGSALLKHVTDESCGGPQMLF